eukprot:TRINITY_DN11787_c1_g1_i1.p4 TRINITY_DN11787_c1_g1~~TRINITY_DN11787_c1_g1_i1.p4  ORF type:complete len:129 (-),score=21.53 TRINITY_DN11787_c1_g1_i1:311-697(-)
MEELAPQVRLRLAQVADVKRFSSDPTNPVTQKEVKIAELMEAAMSQVPGAPLSFEQQVIHIYALQSARLNELKVDKIQNVLELLFERVKSKNPSLVEELKTTFILTEKGKRFIETVAEEIVMELQSSL